MKRRLSKIGLTLLVGAAAPHVSHSDWRVQSFASAVVALAALYVQSPNKKTDRPPRQDPPKD